MCQKVFNSCAGFCHALCSFQCFSMYCAVCIVLVYIVQDTVLCNVVCSMEYFGMYCAMYCAVFWHVLYVVQCCAMYCAMRCITVVPCIVQCFGTYYAMCSVVPCIVRCAVPCIVQAVYWQGISGWQYNRSRQSTLLCILDTVYTVHCIQYLQHSAR